MDARDVIFELQQIALEQEGEFHPIFLVGFVSREGDTSIGIRVVADDRMLQLIRDVPQSQLWLYKGIDDALQGNKPPDDQPKGVTIRRYTIREGGTHGKGLPS